MKIGPELHLGYCTNIHPGETWPEVMRNIEGQVRAVRDRVAPDRAFGIGLRLSGQAAEALDQPRTLDDFRSYLDENRLYVFTINGFPHGAFHGTRVKEDVYRPDWLEDERVTYADRLASILARILPASVAEGSVSTVPGAFAARITGAADAERLGHNMLRHLAHLATLERKITLALEAEPACHFETVEQTIAFFDAQIFSKKSVKKFHEMSGRGEEFLRAHAGVCFDACHSAIQFEDPGEALTRLARAGVKIAKFQISAGLEVQIAPGDTLESLEPFAEGVYLHQVVERRDGRTTRYVDLPEAIAAVRRAPDASRTWRIHFHVPIFRESLGPFSSTQRDLSRLLEIIRRESPAPHLEVETYCWDVLPPEHRQDDIVTAVARELSWAAERLAR